MVFSALSMAALLILSKLEIVKLGWSWLIVIGTVLTFILGFVLGPRLDTPEQTGPEHQPV